MAIDQGTTGTTVLLVNEHLEVVSKKNSEFQQIFPQPGWVEHDLSDIWESAEKALKEMLESEGIDPARIAAIGLTNQRETVGLWKRGTMEPLSHAVVWQCRRTEERCRELKEKGEEEAIHQKTGLVLDPYFSATKIEWMLNHTPRARERGKAGELVVGTIDSYLAGRLSGGELHVTDVSNASRTMLLNLKTQAYDPWLLDLFGVPEAMLPSVCSSSEIYGVTRGLDCLPDGIPIAGIAGDQQAALFGQACFEEGDLKCTYGTGAFVLLNTGPKPRFSKKGMLTTLACKLGREGKTQFAVEGSVFCAGAAVQWLRDGLGMISCSADVESLAASVEDSKGLVFVPAFTGLGAPHWRPDVRASLLGLTRDVTSAHVARATLEAIALQCGEVFSAMADEGVPMKSICVDGGAAVNNLLMQLQADLSGVTVVRPRVTETTAFGAALLAGLAVGFFRSISEIRASWAVERRFEPKMPEAVVRRIWSKWRTAIGRL